jgi:hypothetical protein
MLVATRCVSWSSPRAPGQPVRQVSVIAVSPRKSAISARRVSCRGAEG